MAVGASKEIFSRFVVDKLKLLDGLPALAEKSEKRVAPLFRVSTKKQIKTKRTDKPLSRAEQVDIDLPLQRSICEDYVDGKEDEGWTYATDERGEKLEYIEGGVSAFKTHMSRRKVLTQALDDAKAGKYDVLLVYKLDRFGRRTEAFEYVKKFLYTGIELWVVEENNAIRASGSMDEMILFLKLWHAKVSSEDTRDRVGRAMVKVFEAGLWTGGEPTYGYRLKEKYHIEKDPEESVTMRTIFDLYIREGWGVVKIAKHLNREGKRTRYGGMWQPRYILELLGNPIYKGFPAYGKRPIIDTEIGAKQKRAKKEYWLVAKDKNPDLVIVEEDMWQLAQELRARRKQKFNESSGQYHVTRQGSSGLLLAGVCYCGGCGHSLTSKWGTSSWKDKEGKPQKRKYQYYSCPKAKDEGEAVCSAKKKNIDANKCEEMVLRQIKKFVKEYVVGENVLAKFREVVDNTRSNVQDDLKLIELEIRKQTTIKNNAIAGIDRHMAGEATDDDLSPRMLERQLDAAEAKMIELNAKRSTLAEQRTAANHVNAEQLMGIAELLQGFDKMVDAADFGIKRELAIACVERVELHADYIDITMHVDLPKLINALAGAAAGTEISAGLAGTVATLPVRLVSESTTVRVMDEHKNTRLDDLEKIIEYLRSKSEPIPLRKIIAETSEFIQWGKNTTEQMRLYMKRSDGSVCRPKQGHYGLKG